MHRSCSSLTHKRSIVHRFFISECMHTWYIICARGSISIGTKPYWDKALLEHSLIGTKPYWYKALLGHSLIGTKLYWNRALLGQNFIGTKPYWDKVPLGQSRLGTKPDRDIALLGQSIISAKLQWHSKGKASAKRMDCLCTYIFLQSKLQSLTWHKRRRQSKVACILTPKT